MPKLMNLIEQRKVWKKLSNLIILIPLIILIKDLIGKTRLLKVSLATILKFDTENQMQDEDLIWYRYGPYYPKGEAIIQYLLKNKLIEELIDSSKSSKNNIKQKNIQQTKYTLTKFGIEWISKRIDEIKDEPPYSEVVEYIKKCIFTPLPQLIEYILEESKEKGFNYENKSFSGKIHIKIFDWSDYGSGTIKPYHYTLLYSYARMEYYMKQLQTKFKQNWPDNSCKIIYEQIPEIIKSVDLYRNINNKKPDILIPLSAIFEKQDPPYLTQDKIEAKNYIHNLWYIVEAVNIFHVIASISPTLNNIATLCLSNYLVHLEMAEIDTIEQDNTRSKLKKIREQLIRNEINKLCKYGILKREKYGRKYVYTLAAKCLYDELLDKKYSVLDPSTLKSLYKMRIRPQAKLDFPANRD